MVRNKDGKPFAKGCLNNPKLVDGFIRYTEISHANGFEGMFVDEPTPQECFCDQCKSLFRETYGKIFSQVRALRNIEHSGSTQSRNTPNSCANG